MCGSGSATRPRPGRATCSQARPARTEQRAGFPRFVGRCRVSSHAGFRPLARPLSSAASNSERATVSASLILIVRILFAWPVAVLLAGSLWGWLFDGIGGVFALLAVGAMALALLGAITHVRRVSLLAGRLDAAVLAKIGRASCRERVYVAGG